MKKFDEYNLKEVHSILLENDKIELELIDFGATLVRCVLKENNADVVQGFDCVDGYLRQERYMGATVGRVCNRIGKGQFVLNGIEYHTPVNNGPNTLHGGPRGFDHQLFEVLETSKEHAVFRYISQDGEEGFPGELTLIVTYRLLEDGFVFETEATSTQDTLCSITNHAFFNMNGCDSDTALNHRLVLDVDYVGESDKDGLTLKDAFDVTGTPFDFRNGAILKDMLQKESEDAQLKNGNGIDHCFILKPNAMISMEGTKALMRVETTLPCLHVYTGNFQNGTACGKQGIYYQRRSSICYEPEYYPNAIQYDTWEKPILKKGDVQKHCTKYHFTVK